MMNKDSSMSSFLDFNKESELLNIHNKNFFSEFKLVSSEENPLISESYHSILNKVFQASNSFIIQTDYSGSITKILSLSEENILNHSRISVGNKIADIFDPIAKEEVLHNIYQAVNKKSVRTLEVSLTKNGIEHIYELVIIPSIGRELLFYFQQVTEKRKIEDNLKRSDELLKSIWNNSFDGMRLTNKDGVVIAVNNAFCKILGVRAEEIIGKQYTDVYQTNNGNSEKIENDLWKKSAREYAERELHVKSGKHIFVNIMYTLVTDVFSEKTNSLPGQYLLLSVFRDLTEKVHNNNKIKDTERLTIFGKMSAYLAHQIKTPLATIKMNLDLLGKSAAIPDHNIRSFKIIGDEIDRLNKLLRNTFLFLKRADNIEIEIDLNELISSIEDFFKLLLIEKGIKFVNDTNHFVVKGDYQKIRMIFILLIENSIDAIKREGHIKIRNENYKNGEVYSFYIEDSGEGIVDSESIFETFYTTKTHGTGLGLPIVKNLLSEIGGKLNLISSECGKTIFKVTLPINGRNNGKNTNH